MSVDRMHPLTLSFPPELEREFADDYFEKSLKQVRFGLFLAAVLYGIFGFLDGQMVPEARHEIWFIRYAIVCPALLIALAFTWSPHFKRYMQLTISALMVLAGLGIIGMIVCASPPGSYLYYVGLILVVMYACTFVRMRFPVAIISCWILLGSYEVAALFLTETPLAIFINNNFFYLGANLIGGMAGYSIERLMRRDFLQTRELEAEREKAERLLLNILPPEIADRLKEEQKVIAESFAEVTVLFADIVGFTRLSSQLPPEAVVALLNDVFSAFDELAERHGLEKIKTIGDAYMVVGGLPLPRADHAEAVASMALDMLEALRHLNASRKWSLGIRIGVNTGPVVAGVIGTRKFIYDLWGDTVNIASRMESQGVPGAIQVTRDTYERVSSSFQLEYRGTVDVKGKGEMDAWLLLGRLDQPAAAVNAS